MIGLELSMMPCLLSRLASVTWTKTVLSRLFDFQCRAAMELEDIWREKERKTLWRMCEGFCVIFVVLLRRILGWFEGTWRGANTASRQEAIGIGARCQKNERLHHTSCTVYVDNQLSIEDVKRAEYLQRAFGVTCKHHNCAGWCNILGISFKVKLKFSCASGPLIFFGKESGVRSVPLSKKYACDILFPDSAGGVKWTKVGS